MIEVNYRFAVECLKRQASIHGREYKYENLRIKRFIRVSVGALYRQFNSTHVVDRITLVSSVHLRLLSYLLYVAN